MLPSPPCICCTLWNNTWALSTRGHRVSYSAYSLKHLHQPSSSIWSHSSLALAYLKHWLLGCIAPVIVQQQTGSCANYSTYAIHFRTHPTPSGATPCIMTYVSRNSYVSTFHTYQMISSPLGKIPYLYLLTCPKIRRSKHSDAYAD